MNGPVAPGVISVLISMVGAGVAGLLLPRGLALMARAGFMLPNFRGQAVPAAAGIIIALIYASCLSLWAVASPAPIVQTLSFVTVAMALVGFVDDVLGDKETQGLAGHVRLLLAGGLTTGGIKAVFGVIVSVAASAAVTDGLFAFVMGTAVIALSANAVNLLDLRPGRAVKGAIVFAAGLYVVSMGALVWPYLLPLMAVLLVYAPYDLQARAMLGDTGANTVGALLGVAAAASFTPAGLTVLLAALAALHVWAERGSISRTIERVPVLKALDEWGRR